MLPTERLVMKWFVRKQTTDSPRLLSLSPLRCGADATDVSGETACYRQSSACADLSPHHHHHHHHHQRRSRIGEPIYRREILQNRIADVQAYEIPKFSSLCMILIQFSPSTSRSSNWPVSKPYSYHSMYSFTFHMFLLRATCPAPPTVIIYQPDSLYPGVISYINPLFFFLAYALLFCK